MVGAIASLGLKDLVQKRRNIVVGIRGETVEWLDKQSYPILPSEANMIMVDVRQPGGAFGKDMHKEKVVIGRTRPTLPNHVRVSIGTRDEVAKFREAFRRVMNA